jgi:putative hydroxymethylpyrimidine transport system substrate-binding protein
LRSTVARVVLFVLLCSASATGATLRVGLDFFPNPNHVPLYLALEAGSFARAGLDVDLVVPANPSDPVKLTAAGSLDLCLTPQINYLIARSEGLPLIAVGALIDHTLGGLLCLARDGIASLADLAGKRIGYALEPLEPILWRTMLECAGVDAGDVQLINVGYNTVVSLLSGGVDAVGAFRNFEPIEVELLGEPTVFFPQEAYCIPSTYDLLFVANPRVVADRGSELAAFLRVVAEAVDATRSDPAAAFDAFLAAQPDLDDELNRRAFDATLPLYASSVRHDDPAIWEGMVEYLTANGLLAQPMPLETLYVTSLLPDSN